ncbi:MAG: sugar phosphate isomerase/epimerase [Deltaproteobacteria bacterium]|nr:sugar phosphate isomerase/epimerase [Deltaproteobacteria bacterium]
MAIIGGRAHTIEQIHEVGKLGYPFAEISLKVPEAVERELNELLRLKQTYGLYYLAHYPNEGNPADTEALRQRFLPLMKRLFELSAALGIEKGTLHFWMDGRWITHDLVSRKIELLSEMTGAAGRQGVVLCLENLSERSDTFREAFEAIPELRMTLDIGHGQLLARKNTSFEFIENCLPRIAHLHVHDNLGGNSVKDDLHLPLGEGIVDYPKIFTLLRRKGYKETVTMELPPAAMPATHEKILKYLEPPS